MDAELGIDVFEVGLDGVLRDEEAPRYLAVRESS
jgi:hypothetical protein